MGKLIRESEFSKVVRGDLRQRYDVVRVETKLEDGWSDLLAVERSTGLPCFLELKQIDHLGRDNCTRPDLAPEQALFLYERLCGSELSGAAVLIGVGQSEMYLLPARKDPKWTIWVRSRLCLPELPPPLCFRVRHSQLSEALQEAYRGRFTPVLPNALEAA